MARTSATDPLRNFKFRVKIFPNGNAEGESAGGLSQIFGSGGLNMGFSAVSGLTVQNEMIAYREGGMNTHPHKMIGQSDYGPVTFSKGVFADQDYLYDWQQFLHSWTQGGSGTLGSTSTNNDYRCDIQVTVYDHPASSVTYDYNTPSAPTIDGLNIKLAYKLYNCWPASYALGDLNAGDSSLLIQQLVVNHEGFQILWGGSGSVNLGDFSD